MTRRQDGTYPGTRDDSSGSWMTSAADLVGDIASGDAAPALGTADDSLALVRAAAVLLMALAVVEGRARLRRCLASSAQSSTRPTRSHSFIALRRHSRDQGPSHLKSRSTGRTRRARISPSVTTMIHSFIRSRRALGRRLEVHLLISTARTSRLQWRQSIQTQQIIASAQCR